VQSSLQWKIIKHYIFWECLCSLTYPAGNTHAQYHSLNAVVVQSKNCPFGVNTMMELKM
jgi:hypothetical protein